MNARTELASEGWGLGDVMRPAAQGRGRGLPAVTSWGFGAGPAGRPGCRGAGSPLGGAAGRRGGASRPRGSAERAGAALPPPRAGPGLCPGLGGAEGGPEERAAARRALEARARPASVSLVRDGGARAAAERAPGLAETCRSGEGSVFPAARGGRARRGGRCGAAQRAVLPPGARGAAAGTGPRAEPGRVAAELLTPVPRARSSPVAQEIKFARRCGLYFSQVMTWLKNSLNYKMLHRGSFTSHLFPLLSFFKFFIFFCG